jgi:3-hydroxyisobutyrate dehydrogenase-like beta-hydroxyacid dehydrogenase
VDGRGGESRRVAVLGLGEAGGRIAADLAAAGCDVRGWDPDTTRDAAGVARCGSTEQAVAGADVVLSVNSGSAAEAAAAGSAGALSSSSLYADLNTAAPQVKVRVAELIEPTGARFVDVALMAPVPAGGVRTPALASGAGADAFASVFVPLGMPIEVVGSEPGQAAELKLLRSVFMKGLAAVVLESLDAAAAAGHAEWLRGEIVAVLESADDALVQRLVDGSHRHARRRVEELDAAAELLREHGIEPHVTTAAAARLAELLTAERAG